MKHINKNTVVSSAVGGVIALLGVGFTVFYFGRQLGPLKNAILGLNAKVSDSNGMLPGGNNL